MPSKTTPPPIDLGALQQGFARTAKAEAAAERALLRAQQTRDAARVEASAARQALADASRAVLG